MPDETRPVLERLLKRLQELKVPYVRMVHEAVYTSADAARVRGSALHSGAKALIMRAEDAFLMVVLPADLALDNAALRELLGTRRVRFATKEELLELTGLTPGSVPPFGSLFGLRTYCDSALSENEEINFNAGSHTESVRMAYREYVRVEGPNVVRLAKPTSAGESS